MHAPRRQTGDHPESAAHDGRRVAGVDGCPGGWLVAITGTDPGSPTSIAVHATIDEVVGHVRAGALAAAGIDMPIGLARHGARDADAAARLLLGPRRSSLFPTPPRAVLDAADFADALARSRAMCGRGLSIQAFNLLPKMRELAAALTPELQPTVCEVHPETSFAVMRGAPCAWPKRTPDGRAERLAALRHEFAGLDLDELVARPPRGARADDVLDALAAAWTARRIATGDALVLGDADARDDLGYRLTITA